VTFIINSPIIVDIPANITGVGLVAYRVSQL